MREKDYCLKACETCERLFQVPAWDNTEDWPDNCPTCQTFANIHAEIFGATDPDSALSRIARNLAEGHPFITVNWDGMDATFTKGDTPILTAEDIAYTARFFEMQTEKDLSAEWNRPEFAKWFWKAMGE